MTILLFFKKKIESSRVDIDVSALQNVDELWFCKF